MRSQSPPGRLAAGVLGLLGLAALAPLAPAASRFDQFTQKFDKTPDQARVVAAGCLGGSGTEWLVGGGFQPDGTVVVVGVALGPTLEIGAATVAVLGKDAAAPNAPERLPRKDKNGKPLVDKDGKEEWEPFGWKHENATAFVARLSSDLKEVQSVSRFPWKSAGATGAAVDAAGAIYLTGPATDGLAALGGDQKELPVADNGAKSGACDYVYLAKLTPDAGKVEWLRTFKGPSSAPEIDVDKAGKVHFQGPDLRTFDAAGKQESVIVIPGGLTGKTAVNPRDGTFARGGEHHWPTGREPYRDPTLNIYQPDGQLLYELYNWDGPYVGLDNLRLVSDSAVRLVRYDDDGNLVLYAWSDGGNSVMYREPNDVRTFSKKMDGLGFSAYGAGVLSCAYLLKIDPKTYKVAGGALWLAYLPAKDKPNTITINSLGFAGDGSICFAGDSAWGLIQTGNRLNTGEPAGNYVAMLSKDCTSLRFCSGMPACGQTDLNDGGRWGVVRGTVKGKPMALFLCGAVEEENVYGKTLPPPFVNGPQEKYGGGYGDGYLLLLDLSAPGK